MAGDVVVFSDDRFLVSSSGGKTLGGGVSGIGEERREKRCLSLSLSRVQTGVLSLSSKKGKERPDDDVNDDVNDDDESVSRSIEIVCARVAKKKREALFLVRFVCAVFWSTRNGKKSACRMRNYIISFSHRAKPDDDDGGDR